MTSGRTRGSWCHIHLSHLTKKLTSKTLTLTLMSKTLTSMDEVCQCSSNEKFCKVIQAISYLNFCISSFFFTFWGIIVFYSRFLLLMKDTKHACQKGKCKNLVKVITTVYILYRIRIKYLIKCVVRGLFGFYLCNNTAHNKV